MPGHLVEWCREAWRWASRVVHAARPGPDVERKLLEECLDRASSRQSQVLAHAVPSEADLKCRGLAAHFTRVRSEGRLARLRV